MVVRIHNVSKWAALQPGQLLELKGLQPRKVRVELNCPAPTRVDLVEGDKTVFLCIAHGYEVVEFSAGQDVYLSCTSEDEVWYFTNDGDVTAFDAPEAVSFTKIATRRARNPDLERIMFKAEQNALRREAALRSEFEAAMAARDAAAAAAAVPHDPETGEVKGDEPATADDPPATGEAGGAEPQPEASPPAKTAKGAKSNASA